MSVTSTSKSNFNALFSGTAAENVYLYGTGYGATNPVPVYLNSVTNGSITYFTSSSTASQPVNFTGSSTTTLNGLMSVGQSITAVLILTNGATPYYPSAVQVDGTTTGVSTRWIGGYLPSAQTVTANGLDVYTVTLIKTAASTWTVLASYSSFK